MFHCRRLSKENWRGQIFIMLLLNAKMGHSAFFYQTAGNQLKWETKIQNKKCSRSTLLDQWILAGMSEVQALFLGFATEYLSGLQQTLQGPSLWSFLASLPRPVCLPSALLITAHFHLCLIQHCVYAQPQRICCGLHSVVLSLWLSFQTMLFLHKESSSLHFFQSLWHFPITPVKG